MGGKGALGLALWLVACGDSSPAGLHRPLHGGPDASTRAGSGGASPGSGGAGPGSCRSDRECTPFGLLCDQARGRCVRCLADSDCSGSAVCRGGSCEVPIHCANSLDCVDAPDGRVICDAAASNCVECLTSADCIGGSVCDQQHCTSSPSGAGGAGAGGFVGNGGLRGDGGVVASTGGVTSTGGSLGFSGFPFGGFTSTGGAANTGGAFVTGGATSTGGVGQAGAGGSAGTGGAKGTGGSGPCVPAKCPACSSGTPCCLPLLNRCGCGTGVCI